MQVEKREGSRERKILIGMIVDPLVLGGVSAKWNGELFSGTWTNLIGGWCVDFFAKYGKAPGKSIEGIYEAWADDNKDKDTVKLIDGFLAGLSGEYSRHRKELNPQHLLDIAGAHFNKVRLAKLAEQITGNLELGNVEKAEKVVGAYGRVQIGAGSGINLLQDRDAIRRVFARKAEPPLVQYPGDLGQLLNRAMERDGFIAFMGREKIGKTFWLLDLAWRALLDRKRVAFFEVGDLSEEQIIGRFLTRAAYHPLAADSWPCTLKVPTAIDWQDGQEDDDGKQVGKKVRILYEDRVYNEPLSEEAGFAAFASAQKLRVKAKADTPFFKLHVTPNRTLSVAGLKSILQQWERQEEWRPDVVCVDYADILAPPPGFNGDSRDAVNESWMALRTCSQEYHCLVATVTQVKATAYKGGLLDMSDFSEDKRKFAHVTAMFGLNADDDEVEQQIYRVNCLVGREFRHLKRRAVTVAGCLGLAAPAMRSSW